MRVGAAPSAAMALYAPSSTRLVVPVLGSSEEVQDVIVVPVNDLPAEVEEVLDMLAEQAAPLSTWLDFAKAYLAKGREDAFKHMLTEGCSEQVTEEVTRYFGAPPHYEQMQFFCALAALYMAKAKDEQDRTRQAELFTEAAKHVQKAKMKGPSEQMVSIAQGMLHLAKVRALGVRIAASCLQGGAGMAAWRLVHAGEGCKGSSDGAGGTVASHPAHNHRWCWSSRAAPQNEVQQAQQEFARACTQLDHGQPNVMGYLALAQLLFHQKQYKDALLL